MHTTAQINAAWDAAAQKAPAGSARVFYITGLANSTPLTQVIPDGDQSDLDAQLQRTAAELTTVDVPGISLDTGTVDDVRTAPEFVNS